MERSQSPKSSPRKKRASPKLDFVRIAMEKPEWKELYEQEKKLCLDDYYKGRDPNVWFCPLTKYPYFPQFREWLKSKEGQKSPLTPKSKLAQSKALATQKYRKALKAKMKPYPAPKVLKSDPKPTGEFDYLTKLSADVIKEILIDLPPKDLVRACHLNKKLPKICADENFIQRYYEKYYEKYYEEIKERKLELAKEKENRQLAGDDESSDEDDYEEIDDIIKAILNSVEKGNVSFYKKWMNYPGWNPSYDDNYAIRRASANGHVELVKLLLDDKRVSPSDRFNEAIRYAARSGHATVVKLLLEDLRVDPSDEENDAIRVAATNDHTRVVRILLADNRLKLPENFCKKLTRWMRKNHFHEKTIEVLMKDPRFQFESISSDEDDSDESDEDSDSFLQNEVYGNLQNELDGYGDEDEYFSEEWEV